MTAEGGARSAPGNGARHPSLLVGAGHLAVLWALGLVQPLFDLLGRNPDFFIARGNTAGDILVFSLAFTLVPPLAMAALEAIAALVSPRLRWGLHLGLVALLVAVIALQALKGIASGPAWTLIAAALLIGTGGAWAYAATRFAQSLMNILLPAPLVILALFLLFSDVSKLVLPQEEAKAADVRVGRPAPVVMVILDELPEGSLMAADGRIDASRFPNFAELASHSTWYRNMTTVEDGTTRAVPAILTGLIPTPDQLPTDADQPESVFTLLADTYRMNVEEDATHLCPSALCPRQGAESSGERLSSLFSDLRVATEHLLLPDSLRSGLPPVDETFGGFAVTEGGKAPPRRYAVNNPQQLVEALQSRVTGSESAQFESFVASLRGGRTLNFIHVQNPHYPWNHFPNGVQFSNLTSEFGPLFSDAGRWATTPAVTRLALQRHLLEVGFTDHLLGDLIARLKQTGLWNRALILVTPDHGAAFKAHVFRRGAAKTNLGQIAPIPTFIKAPGQRRGRVVERHACTTGILPAMAGLLGIRYPWRREPCPLQEVATATAPTSDTGERVVRLPLETVKRLRSAFVDEIARVFPGPGWGSVLRFGPAPELIGARAARLASGPAAGESATLEDPEHLGDVNPNAAAVFASLLRGSVSGGRPGQAIAAAVNGTVAATGETFDQDGETRFSMLVPPAYFRIGANSVELYRVGGRGPSARLESLGP